MNKSIECQVNVYFGNGYHGQITFKDAPDFPSNSTQIICCEDKIEYANFAFPDEILDEVIKGLQIYKKQKEEIYKKGQEK